MTQHPHEERMQAFYEAADRRDVEAMYQMFAEDAITTIPGRSQFAGRYEGRDAIFELLARALVESEGTIQLKLLGVLANNRYAVTLHQWTAERQGRRAEAKNLNLYRFNDAGLIVERQEFIEDLEAHDEFWSFTT
jgi:ketosteroid isomerase-like protein